MSAELTREQLDHLEAAVKGFVGENWEQGTADDDVHCDGDDGTALVMDWEHLMMLLDCNHHDCGPEMAAAIVAAHNAFPVLLQMARAHLAHVEHTPRNYVHKAMFDQVREERDAAQADLEIARDQIKDAAQIIDTVRRCTVTIGGVVLKGLLDAYGKKWGTNA